MSKTHLRSFNYFVLFFFFLVIKATLAEAATGCPSDSLELQDQTILAGQIVSETARFTITVGPNYIVDPDGTVKIAAETVTLLPGFSAREGSNVRITSDHNYAPIGFEDSYQVEENGTVSGNVLLNDTSLDCDTLTTQLVNDVLHGTLTFNSDGTFIYVHSGDEAAHDQFTYLAVDTNQSKEITAYITISPVNDGPAAHDDLLSVITNTTTTINVLGNDIDVDYGDVLTITSYTAPSNGGTLVNNASSLTYTPAPDYIGQDTFSYTIEDSSGVSSFATVTINVIDVPTCPAASVILQDQTIIASVDTSYRNIIVGPALVVAPGATLRLNSHTISLQPGFKAEEGSTVNLIGSPWEDFNAEPIAEADSFIVNEGAAITGNVLTNDRDAECDPMTAVLVAGPSHGLLALNPDGSFTYTHDNSEATYDSFTYQAMDAELSNMVTVTIKVLPVNDVPVANGDTYTIYSYDTILLDVLANDFDSDPGDTLTISSVSWTSQGGEAVNNGDSITYTPPAFLIGMEFFTYTVQDGNGQEATVTVYIGNSPPEAIAQSVVTDEFKPIQIVLSGEDYDNDQLSYELTSYPERGAITGTPPFITYSPQVVPSGQVSFTFTVSDSFYTSPPATVSITVNYVEKEWTTDYQYDDQGRITGKTMTIGPANN